MKILWKKQWDWKWLPLKEPLLLICDEFFKKRLILKNCPSHIFIYFVKAGEELKSVEHWPAHLSKIQDLLGDAKLGGVIAMGGGSVGDFAGFFASVYRRGIDLYQCPTTWLAAIDSAHGGKTALNLGPYKNQIGTFKQAKTIFICKEILSLQSFELLFDGLSELFKIALIEGGRLWTKANILAYQLYPITMTQGQKTEKNRKSLGLLFETAWDLLKPAVAGKYNIVNKDPFETRGHRQILNLGHTMGHVFELHCNLSHGAAVSYGMDFAIEYSFHKKILKKKEYEALRESPIGRCLYRANNKDIWEKMTLQQIEQGLLKDKKRKADTSQDLDFIFVKGIGSVQRIKVEIQEILKEVLRQSKKSKAQNNIN